MKQHNRWDVKTITLASSVPNRSQGSWRMSPARPMPALKSHSHWGKVPSDWKKPPCPFSRPRGEDTRELQSSQHNPSPERLQGKFSWKPHVKNKNVTRNSQDLPSTSHFINMTTLCDNTLQMTLEQSDLARLLTVSHTIFKMRFLKYGKVEQ